MESPQARKTLHHLYFYSYYEFYKKNTEIKNSATPLDLLTEDNTLTPSETSGTDKQFGGTGRYSKTYPS